MIKVSVIVNCHDGEKYLKEAIESINNQTFKDFEIIFWDNASTDNSAAIAKKNAKNLQYFKSESLIPLGQARNEAIAKCKGEYIAFLDSDDLWDSMKIEKQVEIMERYVDVGLVMTNFRIMNMFKNQISKRKNKKDRTYDFEEFVTEYAYCLSTFMIRKSCVDEMPLWFDNRFEYAEEYDFFSRLVYRSKAYYIGLPLAIRRMHDSMNTIKLAERIPTEHQMTIDNFRSFIPDFEQKYPEVIKKMEFLRDYMDAKQLFPKGEQKKIRRLVRPYIFMQKKAMAYYFITLMPANIGRLIYKCIYYNSI